MSDSYVSPCPPDQGRARRGGAWRRRRRGGDRGRAPAGAAPTAPARAAGALGGEIPLQNKIMSWKKEMRASCKAQERSGTENGRGEVKRREAKSERMCFLP